VLDFFVRDGLGFGVGFETVVELSLCDQPKVAIANVITKTAATCVQERHLEFIIRGPLLLVQMVRALQHRTIRSAMYKGRTLA
jgi:hypothetical protein